MKKVLILALVVLVFFGILAAILFKIFSPTQTNSPQKNIEVVLPITSNTRNSSAFVSLCYKNYITALQRKDDQVPTQTFLDNKDSCFSKDFLDQWTRAAEDSGMDPVLLAQDFGSDWDNDIKTDLISQSSLQESYRVTLGTMNGTDHVLFVLLSVENGSLKIHRVESGNTN